MSTDYEIRCSCGERFSSDNWRNPRQVVALIDLREHFAAIGRRSSDLDGLYGWDAFGSMLPGAFRFFAEHEGHSMTVFDEYGCRWSEEYDRKRTEIYAEMRQPGADQKLLSAQLNDLDREAGAPW